LERQLVPEARGEEADFDVPAALHGTAILQDRRKEGDVFFCALSEWSTVSDRSLCKALLAHASILHKKLMKHQIPCLFYLNSEVSEVSVMLCTVFLNVMNVLCA
jgi:hypothetical protein